MALERAAGEGVARGERPAKPGEAGGLTWRDGAGWLLALLVLLLLSYLRSRHRIFWGDEIVGWTLLQESSFARLYQSWTMGADSSGLWYYVLLRPWLAVFGATEVTARLFTTVGVWTAMVLVWVAARRFFSVGVVAFCVPFAFLSNPTVVVQLSNARTYGLFLAAVAAVALLFLKTAPGERLTAGLLLGTAAAHAFLIGTHVLGVVYSGFFLAGMVARDLPGRRLRWRLYLAGAAGWLALLPIWRNLKANADIGKPYFWTEPPHIPDLPVGLFGYGRSTWGLCLLLAGLLAAARAAGWGEREMEAEREELRARAPMYVLLGTTSAIALFLFFKSLVGNSVFTDRYVLPLMISGALLLCDLVDRVLRRLGRTRQPRVRMAVGVAVLLLLLRRADPFGTEGEDYTAGLVRKIPAGVPAVITDVSTFAEVDHYQKGRARIEAEIDWPFTLSTKSVPRDVTGAHMLAIWRRLGYFPGQILPATEILQQPEFVVVSKESFPLWFEERIAADPQFAVTDLGGAGGRTHQLRVWLVRRKQS